MFRSGVVTVAMALICVAAPALEDKPTTIPAPKGWSIEAAEGIALSPDSQHVAFVVSRIVQRIAVASTVHPSDVRILDGTEGGRAPFWAADGHAIAFFRGNQMLAVDLDGRGMRVICQCGAGRHGSWGSAGTILFSGAIRGGESTIFAVSENGGGIPHSVTKLDESAGESAHDWPEFLPDGRRFIFSTVEWRKTDRGYLKGFFEVYRSDLGAGRRELLAPGGEHGAMLDAETLLFLHDDTQLLLLSLARGGTPEALSGNTDAFHTNGSGGYVWAKFVHLKQLVLVDRRGSLLRVIAGKGEYSRPRISPDGRSVAYQERAKLVIREIRSGKLIAEFDQSERAGVAWSPDSKQVATTMILDGKCQLVAADIATKRLRGISPRCGQVFDWSRDGRFIAADSAFGATVDFIAVDGSLSVVNRKLADSEAEGWIRFAPDGRSVAFDARAPVGTAIMGYNVYTTGTEFRGNELLQDAKPRRISPSGGFRPAWRADGGELFFVDGERRLWSAPVNGRLKMLFIIPRGDGPFAEYDVSGDGQRFVVNRDADDDLVYVRSVKH